MTALRARRSGSLRGRVRAPGDKSISHRALILSALAAGPSEVGGLLEAGDVMATARALRALGVRVRRVRRPAGLRWRIDGVGVGGLAEPARVLDLGNSGTGVRLLMGACAAHSFTTFFTGDSSLRRRPMGRVAEPLRRFGAEIISRDGARLPLALKGAPAPMPVSYALPVPSAQVKSAILIAGLAAPGETTVREAWPTRDHTERLLAHMGAGLRVRALKGGGSRVSLTGQPELAGRAIEVPGDPSSAAFIAAAAVLVPGSRVVIEGAGLNPTRTGFYETLTEMGARIGLTHGAQAGPEPAGEIEARASRLAGVTVPAARAPRMIDEYPILAVCAACAEGETRMEGLAELRLKESDRLAAIRDGLLACGVEAAVEGDTLLVRGRGRRVAGGAVIDAGRDHRIAMAFLVLGLVAERPIKVVGAEAIATSFPGFAAVMGKLGAEIGRA